MDSMTRSRGIARSQYKCVRVCVIFRRGEVGSFAAFVCDSTNMTHDFFKFECCRITFILRGGGVPPLRIALHNITLLRGARLFISVAL